MNLTLTRDEAKRLATDGRVVLFGREIDGRPDSTRCAVVVPCDECGGDRAEAVQWRDWQTVEMIDDCDTCDPDGLVTVGHVVVEWGPLVAVEALMTAPPPTDAVEITPGGGVVLRRVTDHSTWHSWTYTTLTLPPDIDPQTLVGRYAIGIRSV